MNLPSILARNYFFSYLLIAQVTFFWYDRQLIFSFLFLIASFGFFYFKKQFGSTIIIFSIAITILFILQITYFERFRLSSMFRLYMGILFPYFIMKVVGANYIKYLINIIYVITIISLAFYVPSIFSDGFHNLIGKIAPALGTDIYLTDQNFIIYTWEAKDGVILRNAGNFTEPGYFASILNVVLVFNILHEKNIFSKKNLLFIIAILTTMSTGGYITLFFTITAYTLMVSKNKYKLLIIPVSLMLMYISYTQLDFMESKISTHYETQVKGDVEAGRFGNTIADLNDLKEHPVIGRGIIKGTKFDDVEYWERDEGPRQGLNGVTGAMLSFGVFGFALYLYLFITSLRSYVHYNGFDKRSVFIILGCIFLSSASQPLLLTPFYYSFLFIKDLYTTK